MAPTLFGIRLCSFEKVVNASQQLDFELLNPAFTLRLASITLNSSTFWLGPFFECVQIIDLTSSNFSPRMASRTCPRRYETGRHKWTAAESNVLRERTST